MDPADVPNFGLLLAEYIGSVPERSRPRFLARLERGAADRYRGWAAALPEHAETLMQCAASEEQIAIRVDALYPLVPEDLAAIELALPGAIDAYYQAFDGLSPLEQIALQAEAERQGAMAWQNLKRATNPDAHNAELDALTALERRSADIVDSVLAHTASQGAHLND